jgi:hypothetical protein
MADPIVVPAAADHVPPPEPGRTLVNGAKALGELGILPGISLIADGDVKSGALHALGGVVAAALIGPLGWILAGADSYSRSVTGKHIHQHFSWHSPIHFNKS